MLYRKYLLIITMAVLTGCATTLQKQASGFAAVEGKTYDEVFPKVVQAAIDSGLVVTKAEKENGFILATASNNPFLTSNAPAINIIVLDLGETVNVTVKSTVHGQLIDYGTSKNNILGFCNSFSAFFPSTNCTFAE